MMKRWMLLFAVGSIGSAAFAQQTPPIQPKTVDTPKLTPLTLPDAPKNGQIIANAPLTAAEAVKIAIAHQPQVAISKAAADALHGQTLQTRALENPTLVATGSRIEAHTFKNQTQGALVNAGTETDGGLALSQLIFDFNKTRDMVRQSLATERAGYRTFDQTLQDVALTAKQDFYAYTQAQQQTKVDEANLQSRQAQVDLTQAQVSAGTGEPQDLVSAKTLAAQAQIALSQAQLAEKVARVKLSTDMGIDPRTPIVLADSSETNVTLPTDLNTLVDQAIKQRPSILSAIESLKAAGYGVSVARKTDVPTINFLAGYNIAGVSNPFDVQDGSVALTLSWTLIDGGVRLGRVREAEANRSSAAESLRQASFVVIQEVSDAIVSVQAARQQIPIANAEVADAQEGVRIATGSYKAGVTTFQTVITSQANLVQAQTDQVNAVAALATALATLDHAIGKWPVN